MAVPCRNVAHRRSRRRRPARTLSKHHRAYLARPSITTAPRPGGPAPIGLRTATRNACSAFQNRAAESERLTVAGLDIAVSAPIARFCSLPARSAHRPACLVTGSSAETVSGARAADDPGDGSGCDGGSCCLLRAGPAVAGRRGRHRCSPGRGIGVLNIRDRAGRRRWRSHWRPGAGLRRSSSSRGFARWRWRGCALVVMPSTAPSESRSSSTTDRRPVERPAPGCGSRSRAQAPPGSRRGHTGRATLATAFRSRKATGTAARINAPVRANAAG